MKSIKLALQSSETLLEFQDTWARDDGRDEIFQAYKASASLPVYSLVNTAVENVSVFFPSSDGKECFVISSKNAMRYSREMGSVWLGAEEASYEELYAFLPGESFYDEFTFFGQYDSGLVPLAQGHFVTEERMMLDVQVFRGGRPVSQDLALNDAVFSKGSMARVAEVEVWADQTMVQRIMGDGVIVATPTGSTAYSMSAGGPIVEPSSQCLIVTPVCAHQLAARALVLEPTRRVVVQLPRGNRKHLYLSVDGGKAIRLTGGERVEITRSQYKTQLVQLSGRSFYEIINQKLGGYAP